MTNDLFHKIVGIFSLHLGFVYLPLVIKTSSVSLVLGQEWYRFYVLFFGLSGTGSLYNYNIWMDTKRLAYFNE
jgi:hypothetical protein